METSRRGALAAGASAGLALAGCLGRPRTTTCDPDSATRPETDASVGFVGDVMLGRSVDEARADDPPGAVWDDTLGLLDSLDGLCCNLECTLSTRGERYPSRTYYFRADPAWAVPALERAGVAWANLANNHLLDFGVPALEDTVDSLADAGIATSGAGGDVGAAREPARTTVGGVDCAFVSLTDTAPRYAASRGSPGVAYLPLDHRRPTTRRVVTDLLDATGDAELTVASLHWGPNWVARPADQYRAFARWLVDRGVDLVHGHSAHVVQGVEVYRGTPILHDCGDFLDDYVVKPEFRNDRSFLFEVGVRDGRPVELRLHPVVIDGLAVHEAGEPAAAWLRGRMRALSGAMGTVFERDGAALALDLTAC